MTAVEWLINQLEREYNSFPLLNFEACIIAKEMEKQQLEKAYQKGWEDATTQGIKEAYKYQKL